MNEIEFSRDCFWASASQIRNRWETELSLTHVCKSSTRFEAVGSAYEKILVLTGTQFCFVASLYAELELSKTHQTGLPKTPYIFVKTSKKDDPRHLHLSSPKKEQETKSIEQQTVALTTEPHWE